MAIDIQAPNYSGLVAIAGKNAPLNIQPTGALGLQALQQQQAAQDAAQKNALALMQLQQQGQIAMGANRNQQAEMAQQARYQQGLLGNAAQNNRFSHAMDTAKYQQGMQKDQNQMVMDLMKFQQTGNSQQQGHDISREKNSLDAHKQMMDQYNKDNIQTLKEKGAYASYGLLGIKNAKTPEEAQQVRTEFLKGAVDKKFISPEEADSAAKMPISQFSLMMGAHIISAGVASDYKAMQDAGKEKSASGFNMTFDENGNPSSISIDPTAAAKTKAQGELNDRTQALTKLSQLKQEFDPKLFTDKNAFNMSLSAQAERKEGIPVVGSVLDTAAEYMTGKDKKSRAEDLKKSTAYLNQLEQFFNQTYKQPMTGAAVGVEELKGLRAGYLSGDMSSSQYVGALEQLIRKNVGEEEFQKNFLSGGKYSSNPIRDKMIADGHSAAEVDAYLAKKQGK